MNACVFVVLFAVGYVSADCGCLKCSKDLTVAGHSIPVSGCGPVKVIYKGAPESLPGRELPVTIQAPVAAGIAAEVTEVAKDLTYKVMPSTTVTEIIDRPACGFRNDYKIQAPLALPALPVTNVKSCVDRVVLPAPAPVVEETIVQPTFGGSAVISETFAPGYAAGYGPGFGGYGYGAGYGGRWLKRGGLLNGGLLNGGLLNAGLNGGLINGGLINGGLLNGGLLNGGLLNAGLINGGLINGAAVNEIDIVSPAGTVAVGTAPVVEQIVSTGCKAPMVMRRPCGPAVDVISNRCETRKCLYRYRNALIPIVPTSFALILNDENINKENIQIFENVSNVNISSSCTASINNSNVVALHGDNRKKREVPFLKHGYKFLMNMLPEFLQEPIKNTVNVFALTHPDEKLRKLYNQPKQLSLREKILLRNKKNWNLLKKKLFGHKKNIIQKPRVDEYLLEKEARTFSSKLKEPVEYPKFPWLNEIHSRFLNFEENLNSELIPTRLDFDKNLLTTEFPNPKEKFTESEKALFLKKLKKLNEVEKCRIKRSTFFQNYMNKFTQDPQNHVILGSGELALPFYQVKLEDSSEGRQDDEYYYDNDDGEVVSKEQMLRNIIRKELRKYKYEQTNEEDIVQGPYNLNNAIHHSPLFHLISLPIRLIQHFNELPKMITTSKKYFKDFGKNFKKNTLHLVSDVIGDFDNLGPENNILANIVGPLRRKRSIYEINEDENIDAKDEERLMEQYEPDYSLVFEYDANEDISNVLDAKVRKRRYILKMVDEDEVEDYLVEKLSKYLAQTEETYPRNVKTKAHDHYLEDECPRCQMLRRQMNSKTSEESYGQKKVVLEQLTPKIIIDNNGLPFLELGGYKKPMLKSIRKNRRKQHKTVDSLESPEYPYYFSGEVDSEKIGYLIDHARDHVESSHSERFSEMPVKIVKEQISQLLLQIDLLVHMDFDKYDEIYDNLIALQHIKSGVEQDWKRLVISKRIDDMNAKISLLGKFQELQHFKDMTLNGVAYALYEENENKFMTKKLLKILVRLQKLQCIINQVVENVQARLHMGSKFDTKKEIKYVDFFTGLNFVNAKTRNEMICNLNKDRDLALQQNVELLDQLKRLLVYEADSDKVNEEASLLWEMRNIEKLERSAIEDMNQHLHDGYKIKKELKILFDLLKRYETCEAEQRKLLSEFEETSSEGDSEDYSEEDINTTRNKKELSKKKFDVEEFRSRLQERLRKRKMLLKKKKKNNRGNRKSKVESYESDEDE